MVFTLCSIFSNSRDVIQDIKNLHINFIANTLQNIHAQFQLNPCSSFRGEDFWKSLWTTDDRRRTMDDGRQTTTDAKWWQMLTLPSARLANKKHMSAKTLIPRLAGGQWNGITLPAFSCPCDDVWMYKISFESDLPFSRNQLRFAFFC